MSMIYVTSDLHFGHNKDFIYTARGFETIEEMNEAIVERWNAAVSPEDTIYLLGDCIMGDKSNIEYLKRLNGHIYIAYGNHDTDARISLYKECPNIKDVQFGYRIKHKKKTLILTHYPTIVDNGDCHVINLFGHTHQKTPFYKDYMNMIHIGVDTHNCVPMSLDDILSMLKNREVNSNEE